MPRLRIQGRSGDDEQWCFGNGIVTGLEDGKLFFRLALPDRDWLRRPVRLCPAIVSRVSVRVQRFPTESPIRPAVLSESSPFRSGNLSLICA